MQEKAPDFRPEHTAGTTDSQAAKKIESRELSSVDQAKISILVDMLAEKASYQDQENHRKKPVYYPLNPRIYQSIHESMPALAEKIFERHNQPTGETLPQSELKYGEDDLSFLPEEIHELVRNGDYEHAFLKTEALPWTTFVQERGAAAVMVETKAVCRRAVARQLLTKDPDKLPEFLARINDIDLSKGISVRSLVHAYATICAEVNASDDYNQLPDLQKIIGENASRLAQYYRYPNGVRYDEFATLIGLIAGHDPKQALKLIEPYDPILQKDAVYNVAAALARAGEPEQAKSLATNIKAKQEYDFMTSSEINAMVSVTLAQCRQNKDKRDDAWLKAALHRTGTELQLRAADVVALAQYFPQDILDYLGRRITKSWTTQYFEVTNTDIRAVLELAGFRDFAEQKQWFAELTSQKGILDYETFHTFVRSFLLSHPDMKSRDSLPADAMVGYFQRLGNQEQLEKFARSGIATLISDSNDDATNRMLSVVRLTSQAYASHDAMVYNKNFVQLIGSLEQSEAAEVSVVLQALCYMADRPSWAKHTADLNYEVVRTKALDFAQNSEILLVRKKATELLVQLAREGDTEVTAQLTALLRPGRESSEADQRRRAGITQEQQTALRALFELDNADANAAMFNMVTAPEVDVRAKKVIMKNLLKKKYFPETVNAGLEALMKRESRDIDWRDLELLAAVQSIASADLREKATGHTGAAMKLLAESGESAHAIAEKNDGIPSDSFMQWYLFAHGDKELLDKISGMYSAGVRQTELRESLLFGVTNVLEVDDDTIAALASRLKKFPLKTTQDAQALARVLKLLWFNQQAEAMMDVADANDHE